MNIAGSRISIAGFAMILGACSSADYQLPITEFNATDFERTYEIPFDEVWTQLINYSASTFFGIENFEKESGLLTLSFGASNIEQYIDCGHWVMQSTGSVFVVDPNGNVNFNGSYARFLEIYRNGELSGAMNIVVTQLNEGTTRLRVNARYVLSARPDVWAFNSGESASVNVRNAAQGTSSTRTCLPTHFAERAILDAIK